MENTKPKKGMLAKVVVVGLLLVCVAGAVLVYTRPPAAEDRYLDHAPPPGPNARPDPPNPEKQKKLKAAAPAG